MQYIKYGFRWARQFLYAAFVMMVCSSLAIANKTESNDSDPVSEHPAVYRPQDDTAGNIPVALFRGRVNSQPSRYILGPGDKISIQVKDLDKFNQELSIRPDGYGTVHPFGEFMVAGMDVQGLQDWLIDKFKFYLVSPQITVDVKEMRPALVYITGAVKRPGIYQFVRQGSVNATIDKPLEGKVEITLTNILSQAGGVKANADVMNISVSHASTGQTENYNLKELLVDASSRDIWLLPGDVVTVPAMDQPMDPATFKLISQSTFYQEKFPVVVLGAVTNQGEVQLDPNHNSLNAAIGLAGGFLNQVASTDSIIVQRPTGHGAFNRWIINRKSTDLELMPGDVLYVSTAKLNTVERGLKILSTLGQQFFYGVNGTNNLKTLLNEAN